MSKKTIFIICLILSLISVGFVYYEPAAPAFQQDKRLAPMIGKRFDAIDLLDSNNVATELSPEQDSLTILDFWMDQCPGCMREMKQFDTLLRKTKASVSLVSVSINSFNTWKALFHARNNLYSFLGTANPRWTQVVLKSAEDPRLRNDIPMDNLALIKERFQTNQLPLYIVLDAKGQVVAAPESAVAYLQWLNQQEQQPLFVRR
ncbi:TlpA family protein disulfide reductase [Flaviaesturariibacter terrae]